MVLERLKQLSHHVAGTAPPPHPFDPLTAAEIESAVGLINKEHGPLAYNAVTLQEPRKQLMQAWLANPDHTQKPHRIADVVAIKKGGAVYDGLVDLDEGKILGWESTDGVQPLVSATFGFHNGLLTEADHDGGLANCGEDCEDRSQSHRAVCHQRDIKGGHAQSVL